MATVENMQITRPARLLGEPGFYAENPDKIPFGYMIDPENNQDLIQKSEKEDVVSPVQKEISPETTSDVESGLKVEPAAQVESELKLEPAAQVESELKVDSLVQPKASDIDFGEFLKRTIQRGVGGEEPDALISADVVDEQPVTGFTGEDLLDRKQFLDPDPITEESIAEFQSEYERLRKEFEATLPEQLPERERRAQVIYSVLNLKDHVDNNEEYVDQLNQIIDTEYFTNMVIVQGDNRGKGVKYQKNPYYGNPEQFIKDLTPDPDNKVLDTDYLLAYKNNSPIVAPNEKLASGGQFYYDKDTNRIAYVETNMEEWARSAEEMGEAIARGAVEMPVFVAMLSGIADMGLNYAGLGTGEALEYVANKFGLEVDTNIREDFEKAMEESRRGMMVFTQEYETAIQGLREELGQFGDPKSGPEERLAEELVVAGSIVFPLLKKAIKSGKQKAGTWRNATIAQQAIQRSTMIKTSEIALGIVSRKNAFLKSVVDEDRLKIMGIDEKAALIAKEQGQRQADEYSKAMEYLNLDSVVKNKNLRGAAQRYLNIPLNIATNQGALASRLTSEREIKAVAASELMMALGFVTAENQFPDDIVIQLGGGLLGGMWGMRGKNNLINKGPFGVTRKAKNLSRVYWYAINKFLSQSPLFTETQRNMHAHMAENQALKAIGEYDNFIRDFGENATLEEKRAITSGVIKDRTEFQDFVNATHNAEEILSSMPDEFVKQIFGNAEQFQAAIIRLNRSGLMDESKLHETLSDMFTMPILHMLENNLLTQINVGLKLKLNQIPLISDYYHILQMKQENIASVRKLLRNIGDVDDADKVGRYIKTLRENMKKFVNRESAQLSIKQRKLNEKIQTEYKDYKDIIVDPTSQVIKEIQADKAINIATDQAHWTMYGNQLGHYADANRRFGEILDASLQEIDEAYGRVNFTHEFNSNEQIAAVLEGIVDITSRTSQPTRSVVGELPRTNQATSILYTARLRFLNRNLQEKQTAFEKIDYLANLVDSINTNNPNLPDTVLSAPSKARFENTAANLMEAAEGGDLQALDDLQKHINRRAKNLSKVSTAPAGSENAVMGAIYTMGDYSKLRSFVTRKSATHNIGSTRKQFRDVREQMDAALKTVEDSVDQANLANYQEATRLYEVFSNIYKAGTGKILTRKDAQGIPHFGNHYVNEQGRSVNPDTEGAIAVPGEYDLMGTFTAPLFGRNKDKIRESANTFRDIFLDESGNLSPSDADLLLHNFFIQIDWLRGRNVSDPQSQEYTAYLNFMDNYGPLIKTADELQAAGNLANKGTRFTDLKNLGIAYKNRFPHSSDEKIFQLQHSKYMDQITTELAQDKETAESILAEFFNLRRDSLNKNSVFAQLANVDPEAAGDVSRILFGKGRYGGAESLIRRSDPPIPDFPPEMLDDLNEQRRVFQRANIDPREITGPIGSMDLKTNADQVLDYIENGVREYVTDPTSPKAVSPEEAVKLKAGVRALLMQDMTDLIFTRMNKLYFNTNPEDINFGVLGFLKGARGHGLAKSLGKSFTPGSPGLDPAAPSSGAEIIESFTEMAANAAAMEDYLRKNKTLFKRVFSAEHVKNIDDAFKVIVSGGTEKDALEAMRGLFAGYSAGSLQSYFWAAARNVISIRFVASMLGFQAYRMGTTKVIKELLMDENNTKILMTAMRNKTALTDAQEESFRKVFAAGFGPHAASFFTRDMMEDMREAWQNDLEQGRSLSELRGEQLPLDELRAWQMGKTVEQVGKDRLRNQMANLSLNQ